MKAVNALLLQRFFCSILLLLCWFDARDLRVRYFESRYFDTEYFFGETYVISLGTFIAAIVNIGLNRIFIPIYGYIAAAYTTLIGYALMLIYHYCIVRFKLKKDYIFPTKWYIFFMITLIVLQIGIINIYDFNVLRYSIVAIYGGVLCWIVVKEKLLQTILGKLRR